MSIKIKIKNETEGMNFMAKRKFVIECEMNERWVDTFCSMLNKMQSFGALGHSGKVSIFSDGDGDFRPEFKIKTEYTRVAPVKETRDEAFYDAG